MAKHKLWTPNYQIKISKPTNHKWSILGGGGKWSNTNCEHQTTKWKYPNLPTTNDLFWGGVNGQTQIVNTKLPNKNIQTYQPQMINSGGGVNDQTQIVNTKLPNENIQTYQPQMIYSGGGVNGQTQIVNTKLPNKNIQTYQPQMINSGGGG